MFSTISLRFSTDVHSRLYAALAADQQRRVVQLSFTGCVNFSDVDVAWMLEDVGTWLGRWMKLHESGWNEDG